MRSHEWIDRRSLALHEAVAARIEAEPELLELARTNLRRWLAAGGPPVLEEWQRVLACSSLAELLALLRSPGERATRLRQSSPFAGVLAPDQRQAVLHRYESSRP